jgi:hypothetical protein
LNYKVSGTAGELEILTCMQFSFCVAIKRIVDLQEKITLNLKKLHVCDRMSDYLVPLSTTSPDDLNLSSSKRGETPCIFHISVAKYRKWRFGITWEINSK